jgi:hypothetical protein
VADLTLIAVYGVLREACRKAGGQKAALETAPGAQRGKEMRFGGPASRCVMVPLDLVLDGGAEHGEAME